MSPEFVKHCCPVQNCGMNEWAARLLNVFPDKPKIDFDEFLLEGERREQDVLNTLQKSFDPTVECRPTFEQVGQEWIIEEAQRNISLLKAIESILNERMQGMQSLHTSLGRAKPYFESFNNSDGTLRKALESYSMVIEQELQHSRQHIFLGDLKRSLYEMRCDVQKRISDYQKEITNIEKEISQVDKKLMKLKDQMEKLCENRYRSEGVTSDPESSRKDKGTLALITPTSSGNTNPNVGSSSSKENKSDRYAKELDENFLKCEKDIQDESNNLLKVIGVRDNILAATRRAFQKLDKECKKATYFTLRKIVEKDKENIEIQREVMISLTNALDAVDIDEDIQLFILGHIGRGGGSLEYSLQALKLLNNLSPGSHSPTTSTHTIDPSTTRSSSTASLSQSSTILAHHLQPPTATMAQSPSASNMTTRHSIGSIGSRLRGTMLQLADLSQPNHLPDASSLQTPGKTSSISPTNQLLQNARSSFQPWEFTRYLSQIFYAAAESASSDSSWQRDKINQTIFIDVDSRSASTFNSPEERRPVSEMISKRSAMSSSSTSPNGPNSSKSIKDLRRLHTIKKYSTSIQFINQQGRSSPNEVNPNDNTELYITDKHEEAIMWIEKVVQSQAGRDAFTAELNQFRSRKVEIGEGYDALGVVLWIVLNQCQISNDVKNAKVIMMLSQTFYRQLDQSPRSAKISNDESTSQNNKFEDVAEVDESNDETGDETGDEDIGTRRGTQHRQFIKERLMSHPLWQDKGYWEEALWQCAMEQLQTIPYDKPWHSLDRDARQELIRRVHNVIFSQMMALAHSMLELGCTKEQARDFLYRMSNEHQINESQRQQLLSHVLNR